MPQELLFALYIFVLAGFLGHHVISKVPHLLHTPLMAGTNAISGISLVGSLVAAGGDFNKVSTILGGSRLHRLRLERFTLLEIENRHRHQHDATHLLGTQDAELGGDQRTAVMSEQVDLAEAHRVDEVAHGRGVLGDRGPLRRWIGFAVARQVRRVYRAIAGYLGHLGIASTLIYNGVASPELRPDARAHLGLDDAEFVVGGLGRIHEQKGWDVLCRAATMVREQAPEAEFVVVGDGPERQAYAARSECAPVRFVGNESAAKVMPALRTR